MNSSRRPRRERAALHASEGCPFEGCGHTRARSGPFSARYRLHARRRPVQPGVQYQDTDADAGKIDICAVASVMTILSRPTRYQPLSKARPEDPLLAFAPLCGTVVRATTKYCLSGALSWQMQMRRTIAVLQVRMLTYAGYSPTVSALRSGVAIVRRTQERLEFDLEDERYTAPWTPIDGFSVLARSSSCGRFPGSESPYTTRCVGSRVRGGDAVEAALERMVRIGRLRRVSQVNSWTLHEACRQSFSAVHTAARDFGALAPRRKM